MPASLPHSFSTLFRRNSAKTLTKKKPFFLKKIAQSNRHGLVEHTWRLIVLFLNRCLLQGRIIKSMEAVGYQNSFRAQMLGDDQEERPEGQGSGGVVGR